MLSNRLTIVNDKVNLLSRQSENVRVEQSRNVRLTSSGWEGGRKRRPGNEPSRTRPAGVSKEGEQETDYESSGGSRVEGERAASVPSVSCVEGERRQRGCAWAAWPELKPQDQRDARAGSGEDPGQGRLPRLRTHTGQR